MTSPEVFLIHNFAGEEIYVTGKTQKSQSAEAKIMGWVTDEIICEELITSFGTIKIISNLKMQ